MPELIKIKGLLKKAREAEDVEDWLQAAEIHEQELKKDNLQDKAYDRLMIVYRKLKDYRKELTVIDRGKKLLKIIITAK